MKIAISAGHNVYVNNYFDPGATSNPHVEADINKETVAILIPYLIRQGHEVLDVTPYNQKFLNSKAHHETRCKLVDEFQADLYVDVHVNAGGGTGVEAWCHNINSNSVPYATKITNNISKDMGLPNRGVKFNKSYWSLHLTKRPAVIVEGAFIDNKDDMKRLTPRKYAIAIAKAFGDIIEEPKPTQNNSLYRVQVGAYSVKANADKMLSDLKKAGFNGFIKEDIIQIEDTPKEVVLPKQKGKMSDYYKIGDAHIIETIPSNIKIAILGNTLHEADVYGINGTFYDTPKPTDPNSCWAIATNEGKPIGGNSMVNSYDKSIKRGTITYYLDGSMGNKKVNNINEFHKPHDWSIGGYTVKPYMDFKGEKLASGINYRTAHSYIGFDKDNRIYLIVKPNHLIQEIVPLADELGLVGMIVIDGGGSSQLRHPDGSYVSSRKVNNAILLKEV